MLGLLCYHTLGEALWVYVLATVLAISYMLVTKTVHPPAGANPLIMIQQHAGFFSLWQPVALGIIILFLVAMIWSRIVPGIHSYPTGWFKKSPSSVLSEVWKD
jgi:CBS-domain-containing membrane protein